MNLLFTRQQIKERSKGLTFDDVLIVPSRSAVRSRKDPELKGKVTRKVTLGIPIVSSNMDTVTEASMAQAMHALGGLGILHRFMTVETQVKEVEKLRAAGVFPIAASMGVQKEDQQRARALVAAGVQIITLDIAHGHSESMIETIQWVKNTFADIEVIAGNVATPEGVEDLIQVGADAVKVGIGPGSMCTTRIITGCGVPQLTAIALCSEVAEAHGVPLIADGGLKTSGDMMKALAAGANVVMLGSLLAGTLETPGEIKQGRKMYRGMASRSAQESWRGRLPEGMAPEGVVSSVPIKGRAQDVVLELCGGIRSGMSYINAITLAEISEKARFIEMTGAGVQESHAHGLALYR